MRNSESILRDLHRISTDNHRCFGCGQEHDCSIHGCAIIREAAALIEGLQGSLTASEEARSELGKRLADDGAAESARKDIGIQCLAGRCS